METPTPIEETAPPAPEVPPGEDSVDEFVRPFVKWGDRCYGLCVQDSIVTTAPDENKDWTEYHLDYRGGGVWEIEVCPTENTGWTVWRGKLPNRAVFVMIMQNMEDAPPIDWTNDQGQLSSQKSIGTTILDYAELLKCRECGAIGTRAELDHQKCFICGKEGTFPTEEERAAWRIGGLPREPMWEAYGPTISPLTMEHESSVGPTEINDVAGPLCIVSGDTDEESLRNAKRIADLLNLYGLANKQI